MSTILKKALLTPSVSGRLEIILGPMFSGKSTELLRRIRRFKHAHLSCLVVKSAKDSRYNKCNVSTHDNQMMDANSILVLNEIKPVSKSYCVRLYFSMECINFSGYLGSVA